MRTCGLYFTPKVQRPHSFQISVGHATLNPSCPISNLALGPATNDKVTSTGSVLSASIWSVDAKVKGSLYSFGGPSLYFIFLFHIRVQLINNAVIVSDEQ